MKAWAFGGLGLLGLTVAACMGGGPSEDGHVDDPGGGGTILSADAGPRPPMDAGAGHTPDAGAPTDAGEGPVEPVELPTTQGWEFFGPQHGGPRKVLGVSADDGGNIWVAGGMDGLYLLTPGAAQFRRFTAADGLGSYTDAAGVHPSEVISVRGAASGTVYVGYRGIHGGADDNDPEYMRKSGDADRVTVTQTGIAVQHVDIATPPNVDPHYPQGRDKIRDVLRIERNPQTGDIWFGGNHGVALLDGVSGALFEHEHAAINGYVNGTYTLLSGDWYGVSLTQTGDVWIGGGHRIGLLPYGTSGRNWWARYDAVDVWPDRVPANAHPQDRTDDYVQDMAAMEDGSVWVGSIPNGLARVGATGTSYVSGLVDPKVTSLERDPLDSSLWVGHLYGGITRLQGGQARPYDYRVFGSALIQGAVGDIQSHGTGPNRWILVAFSTGAVGIYRGP